MIEGTKCKYVRHFKVNIRIWIGSFIQASADSISGLLLFVAKESSTDISVYWGDYWNITVLLTSTDKQNSTITQVKSHKVSFWTVKINSSKARQFDPHGTEPYPPLSYPIKSSGSRMHG